LDSSAQRRVKRKDDDCWQNQSLEVCVCEKIVDQIWFMDPTDRRLWEAESGVNHRTLAL